MSSRPLIFALALCAVPLGQASAAANKAPSSSSTQARLVFYAVHSEGDLASWKLKDRLRSYQHAKLGCKLPGASGSSLPGSVRVTAVLTAAGKLKIKQLKASSKHRGLESCLRRAMAKWVVWDDKGEAGSEIKFSFYISYRGGNSADIARKAGILGVLKSGKGTGSVFGNLRGSSVGRGYGGLGTRGTGRGGGGYGTLGRGRHGPYYKSQATVSNVSARGTLGQGVVTWAIEKLRFEANSRYCHQTAAKRDAKIAGRMDLALRVARNGALDKVEVVKSTIDDPSMQSCVMRYLLSYSSYQANTPFPSAKGSTDVRLTITFPKAEQR